MNISAHHSDFEKICHSRWTLHVQKAFVHAPFGKYLRTKGLDGVRGPFKEINASRFARTLICQTGFAGNCHMLYFKEYLFRSVWDIIKHLFRKSRARRAFNASIMLQQNGLNAPEVVAIGELYYGPFRAKNFLITREIENAKDIYSYLYKYRRNITSQFRHYKRSLICELGRTIGKMHAAGIFHGDLRPGNILAEHTGEHWKFFFMDNERTKQYQHLPYYFRLKNLVQVNMLQNYFTNTDRMRFLKLYLQSNPNLKHNKQFLVRRVMLRTQQRLKLKHENKQ